MRELGCQCYIGMFAFSLHIAELSCELGTALCGSLGCVTLHAVGFSVEPVTIMPHARGKVPIEHDQPGTRIALKKRCTLILGASDEYDASLIKVCQVLAKL